MVFWRFLEAKEEDLPFEDGIEIPEGEEYGGVTFEEEEEGVEMVVGVEILLGANSFEVLMDVDGVTEKLEHDGAICGVRRGVVSLKRDHDYIEDESYT